MHNSFNVECRIATIGDLKFVGKRNNLPLQTVTVIIDRPSPTNPHQKLHDSPDITFRGKITDVFTSNEIEKGDACTLHFHIETREAAGRKFTNLVADRIGVLEKAEKEPA